MIILICIVFSSVFLHVVPALRFPSTIKMFSWRTALCLSMFFLTCLRFESYHHQQTQLLERIQVSRFQHFYLHLCLFFTSNIITHLPDNNLEDLFLFYISLVFHILKSNLSMDIFDILAFEIVFHESIDL